MRNFLIPSQDVAIYQEFDIRQTGLDEILIVGKTNFGSYAVRSLVQFDITTISASLANGTLPISTSFDLVLYVASADKLQNGQTLEFKPLSQSWIEGTGYFYQDITQSIDGATWTNNTSSSLWANGTGSLGGSTQSIAPILTTIANPVVDITCDITSMVLSWVSGTYHNYGLVIKFPDSDEHNITNQGSINFFSKDTHTIYRPSLVTKWNDQIYNTGSLLSSPTSSLFVVPSGLKSSYHAYETVRVDLTARTRYPLKTFNTALSAYQGNTALPTSSYFSIIDEQAGTTIIPFDSYSLVSVDTNCSYIKFKIQNMYPLRYYRVLIKVDHNGLSEIFDDNAIFTVKS